MFNDNVVKILEKYSKYLCLNVQTNSETEVITCLKIFKINLLVLDERN